MRLLNFIWHLPRNIVAYLIRGYQKILSPDHGGVLKWIWPNGYCKFQPTCSAYAHESIKKYGLLKGGVKSIWRILRCNPWSKGGHDPV